MKFKKLDINQKLEIEQIEYLEILMKDFGAILAGGTAYEFFKGTKIKKHLNSHPSVDIDLYFRKEEDYKDAIDFIETIILSDNQSKHDHYTPNSYLMHSSIEKSATGLCHNFNNNGLKYQLVGCIFGNPKEIVTSFDFKNLEVGYYYDEKKKDYLCIYSSNAKNTVELDIRHTRSPFLMHRIYKYINYRGFKSVTEDSKQHITDWLIKAASGYYYENTDKCPSIYVDLVNNYFVKKFLSNRDIIADEDLVYLIGKIKEKEYEIEKYITVDGYTRSEFVFKGTKDYAIEEMKNRGAQ